MCIPAAGMWLWTWLFASPHTLSVALGPAPQMLLITSAAALGVVASVVCINAYVLDLKVQTFQAVQDGRLSRVNANIEMKLISVDANIQAKLISMDANIEAKLISMDAKITTLQAAQDAKLSSLQATFSTELDAKLAENIAKLQKVRVVCQCCNIARGACMHYNKGASTPM